MPAPGLEPRDLKFTNANPYPGCLTTAPQLSKNRLIRIPINRKKRNNDRISVSTLYYHVVRLIAFIVKKELLVGVTSSITL